MRAWGSVLLGGQTEIGRGSGFGITPAIRYNQAVNAKALFLPPLLGLLAACAAAPAPSPMTGDIVELTSSAVALSAEEQDVLADAGMRHLCLPLGMADAPAAMQLPARLRGGVILKLVVPESKRGLLADGAFRKRLFSAVRDWAVKAGVSETQVTAVLFHFEGAGCPSEVKGAKELVEALRPLKVACGAGIPLFWISDSMTRAFQDFDFTVIFGQGCAWPPSLDPSLAAVYRGQTRENKPVEPGLPHYQAVSMASTGWVTRAAGGTMVVPSVELGAFEEGHGVKFAGQILDNYLVDPQYTYSIGRSIPLGGSSLEPGDSITIALANYPFRRSAFGAWARRPLPGYLGRYLYPYAPSSGGGAIGFGTLRDYLGGVMEGPVPAVELQPSMGGYQLVVTNTTGLYSDLSDFGNYLEWVLPKGRIRDASVGDFARFRFLDGETEEVPVRASSVRFYENYLAPHETIRTGEVFLNGPPAGTLVVHLTLPGGETLDYRFPTR